MFVDQNKQRTCPQKAVRVRINLEWISDLELKLVHYRH